MTEAELESEISQYKEQLAQIDAALKNAPENIELQQVKVDLEEILKLTEESLVELKKQRLLAELNAFESNIAGPSTSSAPIRIDSEDDTDIVGSKCRVHFNCDNTNIQMHNALILGTDSSRENSVRVLFINPTNQSMRICEHFMNDTCRFNDKCKYSHGYQVNVEDLHTYLEPNYESLRVGSSCLTKHTDELWHLASIESIDHENVCVRFKKFNLVKTANWTDIYPLDDPHDEHTDSDDDDDDQDADLSSLSSESSDTFNANVEKKPTSKGESNSDQENIGQWEKYTKGIGSKLMAKMGYVRGQGLGKEGEGRLAPVEVFVLPEGRISLDKVMEMKEKKLLKKKKLQAKKSGTKEELFVEKDEINVFDFLNQTILKKDKVENFPEKSSKSDSSLNQTNSKGLNIKMLETHNRIQDIERHIAKLKQSLSRNKNSDKSTIEQIKQKLAENEQILSRLKKTESDISAEKNNRKKKSEIF